MGEIIVTNGKGINWMAKISLVLIFTIVFSTFMYQGWYSPKPAAAAITELQAWSNVFHGTATTAQNIAYTVPAGSGTNRLLVVAISTSRTTVGSRTVTLTYGGQALTSVSGDMATATIQQHTALYYLDEAGLDAATNTTLSVTVSSGTTRMTDVFAAVFDGVDQTTPIRNSQTYNSGTAQTAGPHAFTTALTVNAGDQAVEIINCTRLASTTLRTITYATNWTMQQEQTSTATDAIRNAVANRSLPGTDTTDTSSTTFSGTALASMTGMTLQVVSVSQLPSTITSCASCHQNAPTFADGTARNTPEGQFPGSHQPHVQGSGIACSVCHVAPATETSADFAHRNGTIQMQTSISGGSYTKGASFAQTNTPAAFTACTNTSCHGTNSGTWGTNTTNNTCTKCHGTPTATVDVTNRYVVAPPVNTAGTSGATTGTGQVSNDAKVGAHQTHIRYLNGVRTTANDTNDDRCGYCHGPLPTSGSHANGSSNPNGSWSGLATHSGTMTPTYAGVTCTNTYCHNPAGTGGTLNTANAGTDSSPDWTNAAYIADGTLKTVANCGVCHKSPWDAGFTSTFAHGAMTTATACTGCHGHEGGTGGVAGQQHMDGIKYGGGSCNSCHGYEATSWATATERAIEGKGAHAQHVAHLATLTGTTLNPATDQFGSGASWTNVCGVCHNGATHSTGEAIGGNGRQISIVVSHQFGASAPAYSGVPATSSSVNPKSCSSVDCHFGTTPVWSAY